MPLAPGPTEFQNMLLAPKILSDPRGPIMELTARYGRMWRSRTLTRHGLRDMVWLLGVEHNERVLGPAYKDDFSWYEGYSFSMEPLFGRDILFLSDDQPELGREGAHRRRHRLLIPAFSTKLDGQYLPAMAQIVARYLDALPLGQPVDLAQTVKQVTFHVVAQLLFGAEPEVLPTLLHQFEQIGLGLFSLVHLRIPGLPFYRASRARKQLAKYIDGRISLYRSGQAGSPTFLAQLLSAEGEDGERLGNETLVSEMLAFLFAGYDTTASMLTSVLLALSENPVVMMQLREELSSLDVEGVLRGQLPETPYLDAVLSETERLCPPLTFALRGAMRDLEVSGYSIRKGDCVTYSPYFTGRDPELYSDPLRFDPQRFYQKKPRPYSLLGFGGGHRPCIGKRFALWEMRLFVATLLLRFDVQFGPQPSDAVYFNPTMQRRDGFWGSLSLNRAAT